MKQCCLCGKSGYEASECGWYRAVPMSKIGHASFTVRDEVKFAIDNVGYGRTRCLCCGGVHTVNLPCPSMRFE